MTVTVPMLVVCGAMLVATVTDVRTLKVHNWLTIPFLLTGLIYHGVTGGFDGLTSSMMNAALVFAILLVPYALGAMGAGDVKLVSALAAWLGSSMTFEIAAIGLFATGVYSLAMLIRQGRLGDAWLHFKVSMYRLQMMARHVASDAEQQTVRDLAQTPQGRARLVPFSAMLAFGVVVALAWRVWQG